MTNKEFLFAGLHILMLAIPDGQADAGRRLCRYWYRESRCQVRTGWQKLCALCGYKSVKICVNPVNLVKKTSCLGVFVAKTPRNLRNPWLMNDLHACKALYICRETSTSIESPLQIRLFMQNEPNFEKAQMNVNKVLTRDYEKNHDFGSRQNKPKQTQSPAGSSAARLHITCCREIPVKYPDNYRGVLFNRGFCLYTTTLLKAQETHLSLYQS